mmetsp:Transcript_8680/g.16423  ORF Transcript_8680/g.16423 Transcript_8680/m.16423 type:complete len:87 (-) Transcript_8680:123-383(-)
MHGIGMCKASAGVDRSATALNSTRGYVRSISPLSGVTLRAPLQYLEKTHHCPPRSKGLVLQCPEKTYHCPLQSKGLVTRTVLEVAK